MNPNNLEIVDLFKSWCDIRVFDHKESINNTPDLNGINGFSDESLWRVLLKQSGLSDENFCFVNRDVDIRNQWIDRSWWYIDNEKLKRNEYVLCNFLRPYSVNFNLVEPVVRFIFGDEYKMDEVLILKR